MKKDKFTEEQKNLIALLPTHEIINTLTDGAKLVLGNIILLYGMDKAVENGYVFRDNKTMVEETGKTEKTVIAGVRKLVQVGLITTKRGKRKNASEYYLTDKYYEISGEERPQQNYSNDYSNNYSKTVEDYSKTIDVMGIIESMQQEINELKKQVEELRITVKSTVKDENYSKTNTDYSTDTDTESEIEKELNLYKNESIILGTEQSSNINDDEIEDIFNDVDRDEQERLQNEWLQYSVKSNNFNKSSNEFKEKNQWATSRIERLKSTIEVYRKCWEQPSMGYYEDSINATFNAIENKTQLGWFTQGQINYFNSLKNNFKSIQEGKREWLEKQPSVTEETTAASNEQFISIDCKNNLGGARQHPQELSNEDIISAFEDDNSGGCAAPSYNEEEYQKAIAEVCDGWTMWELVQNGMETTLGRWHTKIEKQLNGNVSYSDFRDDIVKKLNTNVA